MLKNGFKHLKMLQILKDIKEPYERTLRKENSRLEIDLHRNVSNHVNIVSEGSQ